MKRALAVLTLVGTSIACGLNTDTVAPTVDKPAVTTTATAEEKTFVPAIGEKFPRMVVQTTHGTIVLPDYYTNRGKWFVLFSHPADFTPVCTTEFVEFQKHYKEFKALNTELIGLSEDQVWSHIKWIEWIKKNTGVQIEFPIIADVGGKVAKTLNMLPKGGVDTVRAVFVVDNKGIIRAILYYPLENGRNIPEIIRLVKALQTTDKYGVATPANWYADKINWHGPEIFDGKDYVIVPPATTAKQAKQRLEGAKNGEYQCLDWWFCYKELPAGF
ncbi:MAG: peroxiredoxin [Aquificaceae bacterium]|nr:MAG: peroxiredoxin [Aquificaceae bacterium]